MTVPIPISKIVLVPIGHSATSTLPLMLSMLAPIKAPARGAAGIPVLRAKAPKIPLQLDSRLDLCLASIIKIFGNNFRKKIFSWVYIQIIFLFPLLMSPFVGIILFNE